MHPDSYKIHTIFLASSCPCSWSLWGPSQLVYPYCFLTQSQVDELIEYHAVTLRPVASFASLLSLCRVMQSSIALHTTIHIISYWCDSAFPVDTDHCFCRAVKP